MLFKARSFEIDLSLRTYLMGIVNVTPDSFSDGGDCLDVQAAIDACFRLEKEGADFIDLGAESTRPGSKSVSASQQLDRLLPVLEKITPCIKVPISIDTTSSQVAEACLLKGASVINDISGFCFDPQMAAVVRQFEAGCILMHMRGTPETMQTLTHYGSLIEEVMSELDKSIQIALKAGIERESILIDPGIGFAKNKEQNFSLISQLPSFQQMGFPLLLAPSRKSFLTEVTGEDVLPRERDWATAGVVAVSVLKGANILRVHNVRAMKDVVCVVDRIVNQNKVRVG